MESLFEQLNVVVHNSVRRRKAGRKYSSTNTSVFFCTFCCMNTICCKSSRNVFDLYRLWHRCNIYRHCQILLNFSPMKFIQNWGVQHLWNIYRHCQILLNFSPMKFIQNWGVQHLWVLVLSVNSQESQATIFSELLKYIMYPIAYVTDILSFLCII